MVKTHPMWNDFPDIQNFLLECLELIIEKTTIDNHDINKSVTDLIDSRGKLLRPDYFYLFSRFGDSRLDQHENMVSAAASTEVLHLATLIHDDIIDEADKRRGVETVHSKHGIDLAVYTGDLLLAVYFDLLADATDSVEIIELNTLSMKQVLMGEINQMTNAYNTDVTFDQLGEEFDCSKEELALLEQVGKRLGLFLSRKGDAAAKTPDLHLTEREANILDLLAEGYDNKKNG